MSTASTVAAIAAVNAVNASAASGGGVACATAACTTVIAVGFTVAAFLLIAALIYVFFG